MFKILSNFERTSVLFSSLAISGILLFLCMKLRIPLTYSDFIVGNITWQADTKFQDLAAGPLFIMALFGFLWVSMKLSEKIKNNYDSSCSYEYSSQLILWSIPFLMQITRLLVSNEFQPFYFIISGIGILTLTLFVIYDLWAKRRPNPNLIGYSLLAIFLISLAPFELYMLYSRALILYGIHNIDWVPDLSFYFTVVSVIFYVATFFMYLRENKFFNKYLLKLILSGQVLASLLYLCLLPVPLVQPDGVIYILSTTVIFKFIIFSLISYSIFDIISRYKNSKRQVSLDLFSPFSIFGIFIIIFYGTTLFPSISSDDYHFGEYLIDSLSLLNGRLPYVDYFPAHGFIIDNLPSLVSYFFFDDISASTIGNSTRIAQVFLLLIAFYSLYRFTSNPFLPFLMLILSRNPNHTFIIPFVCIWLNSNLMASPSKWIAIWLVTTPLLLLGLPGQGLILIASFSILFLYQTYNFYKFHNEISIQKLIAITTFILLFLILTPLFQMIIGAIEYVYINGSINMQAYGTPWQETYLMLEGLSSPLLFNIIKTSWIFLIILSLFYFTYYLDKIKKSTYFFHFICISIFLVLIIPYTMGRMDPGYSRTGIMSMHAWTFFFPIIFLPVLGNKGRIVVSLIISLISSLYVLFPAIPYFLSASAPKIPIASIKDGSRFGLKNLGNAIVDEAHWERLNRLKDTLNAILNPKEAYLDLTNRNAHYFYMDRLPIVDTTAPYNMVSTSQQIRNINRLTKNMPRVALIEGENINYDRGLALRTPLLYKFVIDNYRPILINGFIIGILKTEEIPKNQNINVDNIVNIPIKNFTDENYSNGIHRIETAFITSDSVFIKYLYIGQKIKINSTEERTITEIKPSAHSIWFSGKKLDPSQTYDIQIKFEDSSENELSLLDGVFSVQDLQKIPIAWGKSDSSLMKKLDLVTSLTKQDSESNSEYVLDLENINISGHDVGFLRFEYLSKSPTKLKVYWWGDNQNGYSECRSFAFDAKKGVLIVPLDVYPRWLQLKKIIGLKIVFDSPQSDINTMIKNISLLQRKPIS